MASSNGLPRFSVVLPSFNTVRYLRETLETILSQDYPDFEVIVTDGGSTDGTLDVLKGYGDRLRWISEPDRGQCDAINKGFRMATGELHYWANADDPLEPGALRHVAELLRDTDRPQWLVGAAQLLDGKGRDHGVRAPDRVDDSTFLLWATRWIPTQSTFWNRRMWEAAGPFDEDLHYVMDLALWQRMHRVAPAVVTDRVLARYRLHEDSKSLSAVEKSRAERKRHLSRLIARDMQEAEAAGAEAVEALAARYAHLLDELSDQAALVERLGRNRMVGPVLRLYRKRTAWYPELEI